MYQPRRISPMRAGCLRFNNIIVAQDAVEFVVIYIVRTSNIILCYIIFRSGRSNRQLLYCRHHYNTVAGDFAERTVHNIITTLIFESIRPSISTARFIFYSFWGKPKAIKNERCFYCFDLHIRYLPISTWHNHVGAKPTSRRELRVGGIYSYARE